jgi:pimeloyl-ACP methyl ester carboxylesterase
MNRLRVLAMSLVDGVRRHWLRLIGVRSRTFKTTQGRLRMLEVQGSGPLPPMLLVHGLSSAAVDWGPIIRRLRKHCQRIRALDLPGHGRSDPPMDGMGMEAIRQMIQEADMAILDRPQIIMGNSLGGLVAVRMAAHMPEQTLALVLASPGGTPMDKQALSVILDRFHMESWATAHAFVDACTGGPPRKRFALAWGIRARMNRPSVRAMVSQISTDNLLEPAELECLEMPILLVWGKDDGILGPSQLDFYRTHLPDHIELHTPERMGHSPFLDRLEHFVELVLSFCGRLPDFHSHEERS